MSGLKRVLLVAVAVFGTSLLLSPSVNAYGMAGYGGGYAMASPYSYGGCAFNCPWQMVPQNPFMGASVYSPYQSMLGQMRMGPPRPGFYDTVSAINYYQKRPGLSAWYAEDIWTLDAGKATSRMQGSVAR